MEQQPLHKAEVLVKKLEGARRKTQKWRTEAQAAYDKLLLNSTGRPRRSASR